jgi:enolase
MVKIKNIWAREITGRDRLPAIEATVVTDNDCRGVAAVAAGSSVGIYEAKFVYDGGERYFGKGLLKAVSNVNSIIAPELKGLDATKQRDIDPMVGIVTGGSRRYGGGERGGGKPVFEFMSYGAESFSEALYMNWQLSNKFQEIIRKKYNVVLHRRQGLAGIIKDDSEILDVMTEAISDLGFNNRVGFHLDVAAGCFTEKDNFIGLFSRKIKSRDDLIALYKDWCSKYPILDLEDPLNDEDFEGHAILTKELGIQITGDDLFATSPSRLQKGIDLGAANAMVLKVPQIGTITEAFDAIQLAYRNQYNIFPGASRGEGASLADYAVGFNTGISKSIGWGSPLANRYLSIEEELGTASRFPGIKALNLKKP